MIAYHGTSEESGKKIKQEKIYNPSQGKFEWLGTGVYFFIDSIYSASPIEDAKNWAILQAYDKKIKNYRYNRYAVIENCIEGRLKLWDLSSKVGAEIFNSVKKQVLDQLYKVGKRPKGQPIDGYIIDFTKKSINIFDFNAVQSNLSIKLTKEERIKDIRILQPNCTVLSVRDATLIKIKDICEEGDCYE